VASYRFAVAVLIIDWLDAHAGGVQAVATVVLVVLTAYYAWASRALVRETRTTLQAGARATLQARLDRISEISIHDPTLFNKLDDASATGQEQDARFHLCNMFLGIMEEAYMQFAQEHSMTADDWSAWQATADVFLPRPYVRKYWDRVQNTYEPSFRRFVNERMAGQRK
jgi:hypothetical protein